MSNLITPPARREFKEGHWQGSKRLLSIARNHARGVATIYDGWPYKLKDWSEKGGQVYVTMVAAWD